ncbi:MAG: hypothetical protein AAFN93_04100 [Bacteroidota bacterium]
MKDWIPVILLDGDTSNYFNVKGGNIDTLNSGDMFAAKLFMPIREFYDSLGNNIINDNHEMRFVIFPDTRKGGAYPPMTDMKSFLNVKKDTGYINIPVDSIYSRVKWDSVIWQAYVTPTDSTFAITGEWYLNMRNPTTNNK